MQAILQRDCLDRPWHGMQEAQVEDKMLSKPCWDAVSRLMYSAVKCYCALLGGHYTFRFRGLQSRLSGHDERGYCTGQARLFRHEQNVRGSSGNLCD